MMESQYEHQHTEQIVTMVQNHLVDLNMYLNIEANYTVSLVPNKIATIITKSEDIISQPMNGAEKTMFWTAIEYLYHLRAFIKLIGQELDGDFLNTQLGCLYTELVQWCKNAQPVDEMASVWELLHPAQPDVLERVDVGIYEGRWWKPVPVMDIEIIKGTQRIVVLSAPFEPANLPQGLAIRFTVCT